MKLRLIVSTLALAAIAAVAQAKPIRPNRAARDLGLSAAQKSEMRAIRRQGLEKERPVADQLRQNREALRAAVKANDAGQIQTLSKTRGELRGQARAMRGETHAKVYADLTAEQRQKLDARKARAQRRRAKRT